MRPLTHGRLALPGQECEWCLLWQNVQILKNGAIVEGDEHVAIEKVDWSWKRLSSNFNELLQPEASLDRRDDAETSIFATTD